VAVLRARPWPALLLVGPTGSGKTPLGTEIERRGWGRRRCVHFDLGANLRAVAADPAAAEGLTAADISVIRRSLATGALFEDRDLPMIRRLISRFVGLTELGPADLLVLNGLPRHRGQAEGLADLLALERIILLEAAPGVIWERLRLDPGGDRAGRADDGARAVERRLADFRERTLPLLDYYRGIGVPITSIAVTAAMTAADMMREIERAFEREGERP